MSRRKTARPQDRSARPVLDPAGPCPCGLDASYADCCGRFHRGEAAAATAERLMRSRYSAFAVGDEAYLLATWHPGTRPARLGLDPRTRWTGLDVLATTDGGVFHQEGTVTFRAHYREGGRDAVLEEHSTFARVDGAWVYVEAV
ncbi:MAG TPA: YchJ family metal-binding protein [Yinghuangia sp.]|uniref:YchJ family protein n=1 Tax=Yinghuangia sp. YIM S10712 TaxID=3436930 RepID=UPI002CC4F8D3|nr:YchJ family metal-binding protein [Yinghuangia sp.]